MKKLMILFLVSSAVFLGFHTVTAQDVCDDAYTQAELNQCTYEDYQNADKDLNAVYKVLVDTIKKSGDTEAKTKLVEAQRAWIKFRDAECEFSAHPMNGGSGWPMLHNGCMAHLTRVRTDELRSYISIYEY